MHFFSFQHPRDASLPAKGPPGHSKEPARVVWGLGLSEGTPQNVGETDQGLSPPQPGTWGQPQPQAPTIPLDIGLWPGHGDQVQAC